MTPTMPRLGLNTYASSDRDRLSQETDGIAGDYPDIVIGCCAAEATGGWLSLLHDKIRARRSASCSRAGVMPTLTRASSVILRRCCGLLPDDDVYLGHDFIHPASTQEGCVTTATRRLSHSSITTSLSASVQPDADSRRHCSSQALRDHPAPEALTQSAGPSMKRSRQRRQAKTILFNLRARLPDPGLMQLSRGSSRL